MLALLTSLKPASRTSARSRSSSVVGRPRRSRTRMSSMLASRSRSRCRPSPASAPASAPRPVRGGLATTVCRATALVAGAQVRRLNGTGDQKPRAATMHTLGGAAATASARVCVQAAAREPVAAVVAAARGRCGGGPAPAAVTGPARPARAAGNAIAADPTTTRPAGAARAEAAATASARGAAPRWTACRAHLTARPAARAPARGLPAHAAATA